MILPESPPLQSREVEIGVPTASRVRYIHAYVLFINDRDVRLMCSIIDQPDDSCDSIVTPDENAKPQIYDPTGDLRVVEIGDVKVDPNQGKDCHQDVNEQEDLVCTFADIYDGEWCDQ